MSAKKFPRFRWPTITAAACLTAAVGIWLAGGRPDAGSSRTATPQTIGNDTRRDSGAAELRSHLSTASVKEFPGLMKQLLQVRNPETRQQMISTLMQRWLTDDPQSFGVYLDELVVGEEQVWNRLAPGMMAALRELDPAIPKTHLVQSLAERMIVMAAETAPHDALGWAREWLTGSNLDAALGAIAAEMAAINPEAAIKVISEVKALSNRMEACAGVGMTLGEQNTELGLSWASSFALESEQAYALSGVLSGMADRDSSRASAEYSKAVEMMKTRFRERVLADRAAAESEVEEEYEGLSPEEILKAELAKPDPNLVYLEKAAYIIGSALARDNPELALEWAKALDIYQGKNVALEAVFEEWAANSPQEAWQAYLQQPDRGSEVAAKIFTSWATTDVDAASEAALSLGAGPERDSAVEGVAQGWVDAGATPGEIATWSEQLSSHSEKDRVRAIIASESASENPVFAWGQLQQMHNTARRSELFHEIFPSLAENNPKVARRALAAIGLSRVETEYFENMLAH
ncbi:MAG: hypothetical protein EOP88_10115 [Verrucomicrobiaceae bacterium]|nr:MAG: hypothetical protein EOP88_10115 [Verrucomicrobiaceae bacterium]